MKISAGAYDVCFEQGGIRVVRGGKTLYFNTRPVYVSVKTYAAINEFRDTAYERITEQDGTVTGEAVFITKNGSEILVRDIYEARDRKTLKIARNTSATYCFRPPARRRRLPIRHPRCL